jgi:hypothetical protein
MYARRLCWKRKKAAAVMEPSGCFVMMAGLWWVEVRWWRRHKQVHRERAKRLVPMVAMAGWQTGGLSVNKVWRSDNEMGADSTRQQRPAVLLSWCEMVVYWAGWID